MSQTQKLIFCKSINPVDDLDSLTLLERENAQVSHHPIQIFVSYHYISPTFDLGHLCYKCLLNGYPTSIKGTKGSKLESYNDGRSAYPLQE